MVQQQLKYALGVKRGKNAMNPLREAAGKHANGEKGGKICNQ